MRLTTLLSLSLATGALLTGCGDDKQPAAAPPAPPKLHVSVGAGSVKVDQKTLPAGKVVRVDFDVSTAKKHTIDIINNGIQVSTVSVGSADKLHVLLQPLQPGNLTVRVKRQFVKIKVTPA